MTGIESFQPEVIERSDEIGLSTPEMISQTGIGNFEASGVVSTGEVADYLRETIPLTHLENCPTIQYEPMPDPMRPEAGGTFDRGAHEIHIWGPAERFGGEERMLETVTHEVGHNVHENIMANRPEAAEQWANLHEQSFEYCGLDGRGFVSSYARSDLYEDFAETYQAYVRDPERLEFYNPEKYAFMQQEVFAGREYADRTLCSYVDAQGVEWSTSYHVPMGEE